MSVTNVRVDIRDIDQIFELGPSQVTQVFINPPNDRVPGVDDTHFIWCSIRALTIPSFMVAIQSQGAQRGDGGEFLWVVNIANNDSKQKVTFTLQVLIAPSLG